MEEEKFKWNKYYIKSACERFSDMKAIDFHEKVSNARDREGH